MPSSGKTAEKLDHSYIAGGWMVQPFWKKVQQFHLNLNMHLPYSSWVFMLENEKLIFIQNLYMNIHSTSISDYQKLETSQVFFTGWIDKQIHCNTSVQWHIIYRFFRLVVELCLNKSFSVENNKNAFNIPNPAYIKGAQHLL